MQGHRQGWFFIPREFHELLFPSNIYCLSCGALIDRTRPYALCDDCVRRFGWVDGHTCEKCGKPLPGDWTLPLCHDCRTREHAFDRGYTCASYGLYERMLISDFKERGRGYIGRKIGEMMYDRLRAEWGEETGSGGVDALVPVPASAERLRRRGYNQTAVIAGELGHRLGVPCLDVLRRIRRTERMRHLGAQERRDNVAGAFAVRKGRSSLVEGRHILLVDDVYTSGSTADACARTLKEAGARLVDVITFAAGGNYIPSG